MDPQENEKPKYERTDIPQGFTPCTECIKKHPTIFYQESKISYKIIDQMKKNSAYKKNSIPLCKINISHFVSLRPMRGINVTYKTNPLKLYIIHLEAQNTHEIISTLETFSELIKINLGITVLPFLTISETHNEFIICSEKPHPFRSATEQIVTDLSFVTYRQDD